MENVNSGVITNLFKKLFSGIDKAFEASVNRIIDTGINIEDPEKTDDGSMMFTAITGNDVKLKVKCVLVNGRDGMWDVYVQADGKPKEDYPHTTSEKIDDVILEYIEKHIGEDTLESGYNDAKANSEKDWLHDEEADIDINSSKYIKMSISKSNGDVILHAIAANYAIPDVSADVDAILDSPEFIEEIAEEPMAVEIAPDEDTLTYNIVDDTEFDYQQFNENVLRNVLCSMYNMQTIHWNTYNKRFFLIHTKTDEYYHRFIEELDEIAEYMLETEYCVNNPIQILQNIDSEQIVSGEEQTVFDFEQVIDQMKSIIENHICCLDMYYCNVSSDMQSKLDEYMRYWKKECNFILKHMK